MKCFVYCAGGYGGAWVNAKIALALYTGVVYGIEELPDPSRCKIVALDRSTDPQIALLGFVYLLAADGVIKRCLPDGTVINIDFDDEIENIVDEPVSSVPVTVVDDSPVKIKSPSTTTTRLAER